MKPTNRLSAKLAKQVIEKLAPELGPTDTKRLTDLLALLNDKHEAPLGPALAALYPSATTEKAQNSFRVLRSNLANKAAEVLDEPFELQVDTYTKQPLDQRRCWFVGPELTRKNIAAVTRAQIRSDRAVPIRALETENGKPVIRYFLSYAHNDKKSCDPLLDLLRTRLKNSPKYTFVEWRDATGILLGEQWHTEIQETIQTCSFGLLLVSQTFLSRSYIRDNELPHFVPTTAGHIEQTKRAIPVALDDVFNANTDLRGLQHIQIFRHNDRAWSQIRAKQDKESFVNELVAQIHRAIQKYLESPKDGTAQAAKSNDDPHGAHSDEGDAADEYADDRVDKSIVAEQSARYQFSEAVRRHNREYFEKPTPHVPSKAVQGSIEDVAINEANERQSVIAVETLARWLEEADGPDYCALLGETGTGKTTACHELVKRLTTSYELKQQNRQPLYMDLRLLGRSVKDGLTLDVMLNKLWQNVWRAGKLDNDISAESVLQLVQEEGALAIFDGLDEVLVHLDSESAGQAFVRELMRILPPRTSSAKQLPETKRGRVLFTCRTHYFRTLKQERSFLSLTDREGLARFRAAASEKSTAREDHFRALTLLPFSRDQIKAYFALTLPGRDGEELMKLLESVHNLSEIASRPYTLSLLVPEIAQIEEWKKQGKSVSSVSLYRHFADRWIERDLGKHAFTEDHKLQLMEHLAAALWRSGQRSYSAEDLDQWLIDFLTDNPRFANHYTTTSRELLKRDLRTATFMVREGEDQFRFAHSSLQEFFLAGYLCRALRDGQTERWQLRTVSRETFDFLGQMLKEDKEEKDRAEKALKSLRSLRDSYMTQSSELAFEYGLFVHEHSERGHPTHSLAGTQLPNITMRRRVFKGTEQQHLNLSGINFSGAQMQQCEFIHCNLTSANFDGANLDGAIVDRSVAVRSSWDGTQHCGMTLRLSDFEGARVSQDGSVEPINADIDNPENANLVPLFGGITGAFAHSPCGSLIATVHNEEDIWLHEVESGRLLKIIRGNTNAIVLKVKFAPDFVASRLIAGITEFGTIYLWHVASSELIRTIETRSTEVTQAVDFAFSPNFSENALLASHDNVVGVSLWNTATGDCVGSIGREELLKNLRIARDSGDALIAFSPDFAENPLVAASLGNLVLVIDMSTRKRIRVVGSSARITAMAFAPDFKLSRLLATADSHGVVLLWDISQRTHTQRFNPQIHDWTAISDLVFSPNFIDSRTIATASSDGTARMLNVNTGESSQFEDQFIGNMRIAINPRLTDDFELISLGDIIRIWAKQTNQCLRSIEVTFDNPALNSVSFIQNSVVASCARYGNAYIWDCELGSRVELSNDGPYMLRGISLSTRSGNAKLLGGVSASRKAALIWHVPNQRWVRSIEHTNDVVRTMALGPEDAAMPLAATVGSDRVLRLWNVESGACVLIFQQSPYDESVHISFAPDFSNSGLIATCGRHGNVSIWDAKNGDRVTTFEAPQDNEFGFGVRHAEFAPDFATSRLVACCYANGIRVWNVDQLECVFEFLVRMNEYESATAIAFAPNFSLNGLVAATYDNGAVRFWNLHTGMFVCELLDHRNRLTSISFAPDFADSGLLASGGDDGVIRLWNWHTKRCIQRLYHLPNGESLAFDVIANKVIAASENAWRYVRWEVPDDESRVPGAKKLVHAEAFGVFPTSTPNRKLN